MEFIRTKPVPAPPSLHSYGYVVVKDWRILPTGVIAVKVINPKTDETVSWISIESLGKAPSKEKPFIVIDGKLYERKLYAGEVRPLQCLPQQAELRGDLTSSVDTSRVP